MPTLNTCGKIRVAEPYIELLPLSCYVGDGENVKRELSVTNDLKQDLNKFWLRVHSVGLVDKRNPGGSAHTFLTTVSWPHPSVEIMKLQTFFIGGKGEAELCTPILETGVKSDCLLIGYMNVCPKHYAND